MIWDPAWGKERITNMIATRPDWCISRQRIWGVPIAVFLCEGCNQPIIDAALNRTIVDLSSAKARKPGTPPLVDDLLPEGTQLRTLRQHSRFRKETDILDVWFDSGMSWFAVCEADPDLRSPTTTFRTKARHRSACISKAATSTAAGSTLPCSPASRCAAARPTRMCATAGWTLDEQGRAMSKSLGNGVDPVDIANRMGGEIVRLWVASIDFREDMAASENLMAPLRRNLPQAAQYLPLSAGESQRIRSRARSRCRSGTAAARPLHAGPHARAHREDSRAGTRRSSSTASTTR